MYKLGQRYLAHGIKAPEIAKGIFGSNVIFEKEVLRTYLKNNGIRKTLNLIDKELNEITSHGLLDMSKKTLKNIRNALNEIKLLQIAKRRFKGL